MDEWEQVHEAIAKNSWRSLTAEESKFILDGAMYRYAWRGAKLDIVRKYIEPYEAIWDE